MNLKKILLCGIASLVIAGAGYAIVYGVVHSAVGCDGFLYWDTLKASSHADHYDTDDIAGSLQRIERTERWAASQPRCIRENYLRWTGAERRNLEAGTSDKMRDAQAEIDIAKPSFPKPQ